MDAREQQARWDLNSYDSGDPDPLQDNATDHVRVLLSLLDEARAALREARKNRERLLNHVRLEVSRIDAYHGEGLVTRAAVFYAIDHAGQCLCRSERNETCDYCAASRSDSLSRGTP